MNKIKVLHLIKSLGRGGAEMLLPETLALHDKDKFEFHYIYFLPWKNQVVEPIEGNGGRVTCIAATNNVKIILSARKIARYVRENNIAIIHCHLPWAGIVGRLAGKMTKVPVVYTEHNKWERYHSLTYLLNKFTFSWQKVVVPCSHDVAVSIRKHYKKKEPLIETIENGVNTEKFAEETYSAVNIRNELRIDTSKKIIGIISVFRVQKRLHDWLLIASEIHKQNPNTYFIIVGDGPLNSELRQKASDLDMSDYLHFAGLQSEVRPYLKAMDIFMMTSEFEGLPIALLEAMSMQCIPVCTAAGGIPEVVSDGSNGLLTEVATPQVLINKVNGLLNNWEKNAGTLADNARETVMTKFSLKNMVNRLETLYYSIKAAEN